MFWMEIGSAGKHRGDLRVFIVCFLRHLLHNKYDWKNCIGARGENSIEEGIR